MEQCCPNHFLGFCLDDGTPIILVIEGDTQTGWINIETGVFTPGPPPAGTVMCPAGAVPNLSCETDSVTVCQEDPFVVVATDLDIRPLACATDSVTICQPVVNATVTNVAGTNLASVTLLAANPNRKGAILYNDSTNSAFVKFGAVASTTSFTIRLTSQTFYELTIGYVGVIDAIWNNGINGAMRITEFA